MTVIQVNGTSIQTAVNNAQASGDTLDVRGSGNYAGFKIPAGKKVDVIFADQGKTVTALASGSVIEVSGAGSKIAGADVSQGKGQHGAAIAILPGATDVTVEDSKMHDCERGYGIRLYGANTSRAKITRTEVYHVALAYYVDGAGTPGGGAGTVITSPYSHDIDRMLTNDPTSGTDSGGMAFGFKQNGAVTVIDAKSERAYSVMQPAIDPGEPASDDYGWDGSHIELFESGPVTFDVSAPGKGYFYGSPWIVETGKNAAGQDCKNFTFRGYDVFGQWPGTPPTVTEGTNPVKTYTKANVGFLLRSAVDFLIEKNRFHDLDYYLLGLVREGNYATGSTVDRIVAQFNEIWCKPGGFQLMSIGNGITMSPSLLTERDNKVYTQPTGNVVSIVGKGSTRDLNTYQSWAPAGAVWGQNDYWGPYVVTPPAETEVQRLTRERDQALAALATATAQRDAAVAALGASDAKVLTLTAERDTAIAQRDAVTAKLTQAKGLGAQIAGL